MREFINATFAKLPVILGPIVTGGMGLWSSLDPIGMKHWLLTRDWTASSYMLFAGTTIWAAVLYLTRDFAPTQRQRFQKNLRKIRLSLASFERSLLDAKTDDDVVRLVPDVNSFWRDSQSWIERNMGKPALAKFVSGTPQAVHHPWEGTHDPKVANQRSEMIAGLALRGQITDSLLVSNAWDDPPPADLMDRLKWW